MADKTSGGLTMTNREWLAGMTDKMTNTERIIKFCIEYFNVHDADDEQITASDIRIMSYADIGVGWNAVVYMPNGYIYEIGTLENIYGAVALNKYRRVGGSLYNWEDD